MIKKFHITTETRTEYFVDSLFKIRNEMEEVFNQLVDNTIPNETYTTEDLKNYIESLVTGQRVVPGLNGYSYCLTPDIKDMQSDARFDFINLPTIIATATLMKVKLNYPEIAEAIPNYNNVLRKGLLFASLRLHGHGYEALEGTLRAFSIFKKGEVFDFIDENPEFAPKAIQNINRYRENLLDDLLINGSHYSEQNSLFDIASVIFNENIINQHLEKIDDFQALTEFTLRVNKLFPDSLTKSFKERIQAKLETLSVKGNEPTR